MAFRTKTTIHLVAISYKKEQRRSDLMTLRPKILEFMIYEKTWRKQNNYTLPLNERRIKCDYSLRYYYDTIE
jgi:hypothetical protein